MADTTVGTNTPSFATYTAFFTSHSVTHVPHPTADTKLGTYTPPL
jgi:hypothetical protein